MCRGRKGLVGCKNAHYSGSGRRNKLDATENY